MDIRILVAEAERLGIFISERQREQFALYGDLLLAWNQRFNLTRITEEAAVCRQHFLDSIMPVRYFDFSGRSLIDIGSGAGFPGIPLKIMVPSMKLTLLDALDKRCGFLQEAAERTGLHEEGEVVVLHGRAEDMASANRAGEPVYRESFDFAASRAVAKLNVLCEYAVPFLKPGGTFIAYKMRGDLDELAGAQRAGKLLGAGLGRQEVYRLSEPDNERVLYCFEKTGSTPAKYPRRAGVPERKGL